MRFGFQNYVVLCLALTLPAGAAMVVPDSAKSENGKFAIDISQGTELNEILVSVQRMEGQAKTFLWSKTITHTPERLAFAQAFKFHEKAVSNNGDIVVLSDIDLIFLLAQTNRTRRGNGRWFFLQKNAEPRVHTALDIERLLGQRIFDPYPGFTGAFFGYPQRAMLSFFFEAHSVYALWFVAADKWIVIDLHTGKLNLPDPNLTNALNAEATRRALARVRQHQPGPIKELLRPAREKLSSLVPRLDPGAAPDLLKDTQLSASYLFLALRKEPAAEEYIQSLLEYPIKQDLRFHSKVFETAIIGTLSQERVLADLAWRLWNEVPIQKSTPDVLYSPRDFSPPTHFLGGVRGKVHLPMIVPDKSPGSVWVYLIPATIDPGKWRDHDKAVTLFCDLDSRYLRSLRSRLKEVEYQFQTITPGTYRLKAVWDRRPPLAGADGRAFPEPGDYESIESATFTIAAQQTINGPSLDCTNKVGETQAREWFDADEASKKLQSPAADTPPTHSRLSAP